MYAIYCDKDAESIAKEKGFKTIAKYLLSKKVDAAKKPQIDETKDQVWSICNMMWKFEFEKHYFSYVRINIITLLIAQASFRAVCKWSDAAIAVHSKRMKSMATLLWIAKQRMMWYNSELN